jgi:hypothetical protein
MKWYTLTPTERQTRLDALHLEIILCPLTNRGSQSILACRACGYILSPRANSVNKHLKEKHRLPADRYRGLTTFLRTLRLNDPQDLPLPADDLAPLPYLRVRPGYTCSECSYRSLSRLLVKSHLTAQHPDLQGSGQWIRDHIQSAALQSWTLNPPQGYWIVHSSQYFLDPPRSEAVDTSPRRRGHIQALRRSEQAHSCQYVPPAAIQSTTSLDSESLSTWFRRTRWGETYASADRGLLTSLYLSPRSTEPGRFLTRVDERDLFSPRDDEKSLCRVDQAVSRLFTRCEKTASATDTNLRHWLTSHDPYRPYRYPFEFPSLSTRQRYYFTWKRLLFFSLRLYRLSPMIQQSIPRLPARVRT